MTSPLHLDIFIIIALVWDYVLCGDHNYEQFMIEFFKFNNDFAYVLM